MMAYTKTIDVTVATNVREYRRYREVEAPADVVAQLEALDPDSDEYGYSALALLEPYLPSDANEVDVDTCDEAEPNVMWDFPGSANEVG